MNNSQQVYNKKVQETNKFYWFTLAIVSFLVIGVNIYMMIRKPPDIVVQAQPYLVPLPTDVNLNLIQDLQVLQENTPLSPQDFYNLVKKYQVQPNSVNSGSSNINSSK